MGFKLKKWYIVFNYDETGYGDLSLHEDSLTALIIQSRTGSLRQTKDPITGSVASVDLVNALPVGEWLIMDAPVDTTESAMLVPGYKAGGMKVRLYTQCRAYTHYLIHYDGGKPGTKGCIGTQDGDKTLVLMDRISSILKLQKMISVYVNIPPVIDEEEKPEEVPMSKLKKIWNWMNGKKTTIGAVGMIAAAHLPSQITSALPADSEAAVTAAEIVAIIGLLHKMLKKISVLISKK